MSFTPWVATAGNAPVPLALGLGGTGGTWPWSPADDGFLGFDSDPASGGSAALLVAGTAYLARLPIRVTSLVSNLWYNVNVAGVGASSGSFLWLVSGVTGAVLAQSADQGATFTGAVGWHAAAMTVPVTVAAGSFPYAVILCNLVTTQLTTTRQVSSQQNVPQAVSNVASLRWAQQPAFGSAVGAVTLASNAPTNFSNIIGWS
jgi:hypothetical protein